MPHYMCQYMQQSGCDWGYSDADEGEEGEIDDDDNEEEGEISDVDDNDGNADEEEEEGEQEEDSGVSATFNVTFFVNMISPRPEVVRWRSQFPPGHFTRRGGPVVVEARASTDG
jgi:hypothetical protein